MHDNLSDRGVARERSDPENASLAVTHSPERTPAHHTDGHRPTGTNGIWLAIYTLAAAIAAAIAVLIAVAVNADAMQAAAAGGAAFVTVLGLAITAHRFLKEH